MLDSFHPYYLHQRFFPDLFSIVINPFYFIRKSLLKQIKASSDELTGKLLDFGCGSKLTPQPIRYLRSSGKYC
jgi:hypothetical protein